MVLIEDHPPRQTLSFESNVRAVSECIVIQKKIEEGSKVHDFSASVLIGFEE